MTSSTAKKSWAVLLIAASVLTVQMIAIRRPFAGHFASYQGTVMASIARNMVRENFAEILYPKTDAIIGGKRSLHLNQYPFPSLLAALGSKASGESLEFCGRFQAVVFNLLSILLVGLIAGKIFDPLTGWISACVFALSPLTLIYGQSFMSEPCALFFMLAAVYLLVARAGSENSAFPWVLSAIAFSITLTGRLHWIVFYPLFFTLMTRQGRLHPFRNILIFSILSLLLPIGWYAHTYFAALNADNVHTNLFMQVLSQKSSHGACGVPNLAYGQKIFDILSGNMMTPLLFPFLFLGVVLAEKRGFAFRFILAGLGGGILILILAPDKVTKHDFYLYGVYPVLAILAARGLAFLYRGFPILRSGRILSLFLLGYFLVSSRYFLHPLFKYSGQEAAMVRVGLAIKEKTQPEDKIIVFGEGGGVLVYYADRPAWSVPPSMIGKELRPYQKAGGLTLTGSRELSPMEDAMKNAVSWIEYLRAQGASFLVAPDKKEIDTNPELSAHLKNRYRMLSSEKNDYYFFKLT